MSEDTTQQPSEFNEPAGPNKSIEDLEKEKLRLEITNLKKSFWKQATFWPPCFTLLITALVYLGLWKNGTFDAKQAHLTYVTDTLRAYKYRLDSLIVNQKIDTSNLAKIIYAQRHTIDSFHIIIDSVKKKYIIHEKGELTKKELAQELSIFVFNLSNLISSYREQSSSLSNNFFDDSRNARDDRTKLKQLSDDNFKQLLALQNRFMSDYQLKYQNQALYFKEKLGKYFPDNSPQTLNHYEHPANELIVEDVRADLNLLLTKLKATI